VWCATSDEWCGQCLVFAARNKGSSLPNSPRKRSAPESPRGHVADDGVGGDAAGSDKEQAAASRSQSPLSGASQAGGAPPKQPGSRGGGARKGGASSASHLHRNMLDKALHKKIKGTRASGMSSPQASQHLVHTLATMPMMQAHPQMQHLHPPPHMLHGPHGAPPGVIGTMGAMPSVWSYAPPGVYPPAPPRQAHAGK
jgi:hypothetical protein